MPIQAEWHRERGAVLDDTPAGCVVLGYGEVEAEYRALCEGHALFDLSHRSRILATDDDRRRFVHAMCTQPVEKLPVGASVEALFCNKKGKVLAMGRVLAFDEALLLDVDGGSGQMLLEWLERHIIGDFVELADASETLGCWSLIGARGSETLAALDLPEPERAGEHRTAGAITILRTTRLARPAFDLYAPSATLYPLIERVAGAALLVGRAAIEHREVELGIPRYGVDLDEENLPQEAGLDDHISYQKGCYLGQETIARLHYRGRPARMLCALAIEGHDVVPPDSPILRDGEEIGRLTRSAVLAGWPATLALGYLKRDALLDDGYQVAGRRTTARRIIGADGDSAR